MRLLVLKSYLKITCHTCTLRGHFVPEKAAQQFVKVVSSKQKKIVAWTRWLPTLSMGDMYTLKGLSTCNGGYQQAGSPLFFLYLTVMPVYDLPARLYSSTHCIVESQQASSLVISTACRWSQEPAEIAPSEFLTDTESQKMIQIAGPQVD